MTGTPIPDLPIPKEFQDSVSVRTGGDYTFGEALTLRGGAFYETSAVPQKRIDVSQVDGPKIGLSAGATWRSGRWDLAFGYTHVQVFEVDASGNQNLDLNAFAPMLATRADLVARGKYSAHYEIVALGLHTYWGR